MLVYVLGNWRHHGGERYPLGCIDPCSSAAYFDAFVEPRVPVCEFQPPPVAVARSWLLALGYQRHLGKISVDKGLGIDREARRKVARIEAILLTEMA